MAEKNSKKASIPKRAKPTAKKAASNKVAAEKLELLVTVVNRNKAEYYTDLIQSFDVNMQATVLSHGTADAKMLVFLGLSDTEKSVIFSIIQEKKINDAVAVLEKKFNTIKDGKGIAFTIPLTSVIGTLIYRFLSNNRTPVKEEK